MHIFTIITFALGAVTQLVVAAPTLSSRQAAPIPDQYIVVFKNTTEPTTLAVHQAWLETAAKHGSDKAPQYRRLDGTSFPQIKACDYFNYVHKYSSSARGGLNGYAAKLSKNIADSLRQLPEVAFVEQDTMMSIDQVVTPPSTQAGAPWGLRRLSKPRLPLPINYTFDSTAGEGVDVYVIDSGVVASHPEFEGRARIGPDFSTDGNGIDGNGHGTHVAGTIAGKTYGVAKKANIIAVKVFSASGRGPTSNSIAGVNWVIEQVRLTGRKSVINMSLGGPGNAASDSAVRAAVNAGITVVVAAGNDYGQDACLNSPARAPSAITVAASDVNDFIGDFSNIGSCVDIIAPGVDILSSSSRGGARLDSGTSMATPHVSGVVAVAMSAGKVTTPASAVAYLTSTGAKNRIRGLDSTTRNVLAQVEL
ncbi:subtilisin-like serine protease [Chytridiales sp. JEL 0842]|nr:subtilisin-like serine protease [Chytridiales sp. JEL 0842]